MNLFGFTGIFRVSKNTQSSDYHKLKTVSDEYYRLIDKINLKEDESLIQKHNITIKQYHYFKRQYNKMVEVYHNLKFKYITILNS